MKTIKRTSKKIFLSDSIFVFLKFIIWIQIAAPIISLCVGALCWLLAGHAEDFMAFYKNNMLPFQCFLSFTVILACFAKKYYKHIRSRVATRVKLNYKCLLLLLLTSISYSFIDSFINDILSLPNYNISDFNILDHSVIGVISTCLLGPLAEELVFRGTIERRLLKWKRNPWYGILLSALLFGIMHVNPSQMQGAFVMGILLGWVYYRFGSVVPSLVLHILNNVYCFLLDVSGFANLTMEEYCDKLHLPLLVVIAVSIVVFVISVYQLFQRTKIIQYE